MPLGQLLLPMTSANMVTSQQGARDAFRDPDNILGIRDSAFPSQWPEYILRSATMM